MNDPFTINKAKVRELDFALIRRHFKSRKGELRYIGLPARNLIELREWDEYFCHFSAVERGKGNNGFIEQHDLILTSMQYGLGNRLALLRGEMDGILSNGKDEYGNYVQYPFDVVSLDYSGGVVYKDSYGRSRRTEAIVELISRQAEQNKDFLFFISSNLDIDDQGEVRIILKDIARELAKMGIKANAVINAIKSHELDEVRLKIYIPFIIKNMAEKWYKCEFFKPVFYLGNRQTRMMHFSFWLKRTQKYIAGKPTPSDIIDILNLPAFLCENGILTETNFDLPEISV